MEREAFEKLYETYYMRVYSYVMTLAKKQYIAGINIEREVEDHDASYRIHLALSELEEPYRKVFELRIFGELSFREIGSICDKTENWARVTYHRAKLKLQERMSVHETEL